MESKRYIWLMVKFGVAAVTLALCACSSPARRTPVAAPSPTVATGECADPKRDGSLSPAPEIKHANRDLDRDGVDEIVVADRQLCNGRNCHWNLFRVSDRCHQYLGTISGASIEVVSGDEAGFPTLRSWWIFADDRALVSVYHFRELGYRLSETLLCRQSGGDGVRCVSEENR